MEMFSAKSAEFSPVDFCKITLFVNALETRSSSLSDILERTRTCNSGGSLLKDITDNSAEKSMRDRGACQCTCYYKLLSAAVADSVIYYNNNQL